MVPNCQLTSTSNSVTQISPNTSYISLQNESTLSQMSSQAKCGISMDSLKSVDKIDLNGKGLQPRLLHPKKRKFDLSELEELSISNSGTSESFINKNNLSSNTVEVQNVVSEAPCTETIIAVSSAMVPIMFTQKPTISHSFNHKIATPLEYHEKLQLKPESDMMKKTILYKCKPLVNQATLVSIKPQGKAFSNNGLSHLVAFTKANPIQPHNAQNKSVQKVYDQDLIELNDWCDTRVLAKRSCYYATGIIRSTESKTAILVEFDYPECSKELYKDIFNEGRYNIVSDASPSMKDVSIVSCLYNIAIFMSHDK